MYRELIMINVVYVRFGDWDENFVSCGKVDKFDEWELVKSYVDEWIEMNDGYELGGWKGIVDSVDVCRLKDYMLNVFIEIDEFGSCMFNVEKMKLLDELDKVIKFDIDNRKYEIVDVDSVVGEWEEIGELCEGSNMIMRVKGKGKGMIEYYRIVEVEEE